MTLGALRISIIAVGASAFCLLQPASVATAATIVHHPVHGVHHPARRRVADIRGRVHAHRYTRGYAHHYAYGYGYNPGAAVAAGVIGGVLGGLAAGYPYDCGSYGYGYGPYYGSCGLGGYEPYYGFGYSPYYGGYGYGNGGYRHAYGGITGRSLGNIGAARIAGGNFGHMGSFGGAHFGGSGGAHIGSFGGGRMGSLGGGHFGGGAHIR